MKTKNEMEDKLIEKQGNYIAYLQGVIRALRMMSGIEATSLNTGAELKYESEISNLKAGIKEQPVYDEQTERLLTKDDIEIIVGILSQSGRYIMSNNLIMRYDNLINHYASIRQPQLPNNGKSESALNAYAKKCKEDFTKPSGIALGWRACYEWMILQLNNK